MVKPRDISALNEGQARYILIDPALRGAGWNLDDRTQVGFEVPVDGYDAEPWNGVTDYVLPRRIGWSEFADMLEDTDWFPGDLQQALGRLIAQGKVVNLDADGKRKSRFLHYESKNGERLQLTGGN